MVMITRRDGCVFGLAFIGFLTFFYGILSVLVGEYGDEIYPWITIGFFLMIFFSTVQCVSWRRLDRSLSHKPKALERLQLHRRFFLFLLLGGVSLIIAFNRLIVGLLKILPLAISAIAFTISINTVRTLLENARKEDAEHYDERENNGGPGAI